MRILHLCYHYGGAMQAAHRLHETLLAAGNMSVFFVNKAGGSQSGVVTNQTPTGKIWNRALPRLDAIPIKHHYRLVEDKNFSNNYLPGMKIPKKLTREADVIQLHWLGYGMLHPQQLSEFGKPLVWRLPDMFPFTGGCHHSSDCLEFQHECGNCPKLQKAGPRDISYYNLKRKRKYYGIVEDMAVVAPSKWIEDLARSSVVFQGRRIVRIPTGVNIDGYVPMKKEKARKELDFPNAENQLVIAFGGIGATDSHIKGFHLLRESLNKLLSSYKGKAEIKLLLIGVQSNEVDVSLPVPCFYTGHLHDTKSLKLAYNASDVLVIPSMAENLPNMGLEAMACGIPVVGFEIGGLPDFIEHRRNGYICPPFDTGELAEGISWVLEDPNRYRTLSQRARTKMESEFALKICADRYLELYDQITTGS